MVRPAYYTRGSLQHPRNELERSGVQGPATQCIQPSCAIDRPPAFVWFILRCGCLDFVHYVNVTGICMDQQTSHLGSLEEQASCILRVRAPARYANVLQVQAAGPETREQHQMGQPKCTETTG